MNATAHSRAAHISRHCARRARGPRLARGGGIIMKTSSFASLALALALATSPACVDDTTDTDAGDLAAQPHFDLWQDTTSAYRFHLRAANGQILVTSEGYSSRTAALGGLLSVLDNGGLEAHYVVITAVSGEPYFNLVAGNNKIIATSETYSSKAAAQKGVQATIDAVGQYVERWDGGTGARFHVFLGKDGRHYFSLYAQNGEIVLQSQGYDTEASALNGAFSVADNGPKAANWRVQPASGDGTSYYLSLVSANGQVIATSEVYTSQSNATAARDADIALIPTVSIL
jgi:uncharacterized protein YegP (UPF0339 family)